MYKKQEHPALKSIFLSHKYSARHFYLFAVVVFFKAILLHHLNQILLYEILQTSKKVSSLTTLYVMGFSFPCVHFTFDNLYKKHTTFIFV